MHTTPNECAPTVDSVLSHWDDCRKQTLHLHDSKHFKLADLGRESLCLSALQSILDAPLISEESSLNHSSCLNAVQQHCLTTRVSPQMLNCSLILLSLEHLSLPNASAAPDFRLTEAQRAMLCTSLLFDAPFQIPLMKYSCTAVSEHALVEYKTSARELPGNMEGLTKKPTSPRQHERHQLDLPDPLADLSTFTTLECLKRDILIQVLQKVLYTHPYIQTFYHKLSRSVIIVMSTGFDGNSTHSFKWSSHTHSKVGFQNFLRYVLPKYSSQVDEAVVYDMERREAFEAEKKQLLEEKLKALQLEQQSAEGTSTEENATKTSAKGSKQASATKKAPVAKTPSEKLKSSSKDCTPSPSSINMSTIEASLPKFQERKLFSAYDVGDVVLLTEGTTTTQYTADGVQIRTEDYHFVDGEHTLSVSVLDSNQHILSTTLRLKGSKSTQSPTVKQASTEKEDLTGVQSEKPNESNGESKSEVEIVGIPQPPDGVKFACLRADFHDSLSISLSHYGPRGSGSLPFEPALPEILQENERSESTVTSRPPSRQAASPGKLTKKQQEQQQQLLEQQRLLEEEKAREREIAQKIVQRKYDELNRHNKYQQLFVGTPHGLHVHCQVMVDLKASPTVSDGSDGIIVVRQKYPTKSSGQQRGEEQLLQTAYKEKQRCSLPDGTLVRYMSDSSVIIQCPSGSVYCTANEREREQFKAALRTGEPTPTTPNSEATESVERVVSAARVSFAQEESSSGGGKGTEEGWLHEAVWVVTTAKGEQFLWSALGVKGSFSAEEKLPCEEEGSGGSQQSKVELSKDEAKKDATMVDGSTMGGSDEVDSPETKQKGKAVWLRKLQSYPATDPISKEVHTIVCLSLQYVHACIALVINIHYTVPDCV